MRNKIYIATFSKNAISVIKKNQLNIELNHICISENLDVDKIKNTIQDMETDIKESGCKDVILHGPFTEICPGSIDQRAVNLGYDRLNEAYDVAMRLGISKMVVHSGYLPLIYYREWHLEKSVIFWRKFMSDKSSDFNIYIENVFEDDPSMMKELFDDLNDPRIHIALDIGHANVMTKKDISVYDWIKILGKSIGHFHIHNNNGHNDLHSAIDNGNIDMKKIFEAIDEYCSKNVTITIESSDCESSVKWLSENKYI